MEEGIKQDVDDYIHLNQMSSLEVDPSQYPRMSNNLNDNSTSPSNI
jgi:hypothetical protein